MSAGAERLEFSEERPRMKFVLEQRVLGQPYLNTDE
jgi:hypothetical protein